ncbi:MAG: prepilin-type N-terminal cleavage/methylation domain-containing protein [Planctomycetota bacterium]
MSWLKHRKGFSLVELVVVIVIIGILAAVAIPRLSRGAAGATSSNVISNLTIVRNAINLYHAEHNSTFPSADIVNQMTKYSDAGGAVNAARTDVFKYGPYLAAIPKCPVGNIGKDTVLIDAANSPPVPAGNDGWVYNPNTGEFLVNSTAKDDTGKQYNTY